MRVFQPSAAVIRLLIATSSTIILRPDAVHSAGKGLLRNWKKGGVGVGGSGSGLDGYDRASFPSVFVAVESTKSSSSGRLAKPLRASASASSSIEMKLGPTLEGTATARIDYSPSAKVEEDADYWDRIIQTGGEGGGRSPTPPTEAPAEPPMESPTEP